MNYYIGFLLYDPDIDGTDVPFGWRLLTWFQRSDIAHVFMVYEEPEGLFCYETSEVLFRRIPLSERTSGCRCVFYKLPGDGTAAYEFSRSLIGTLYDYPAITGLGAMLLLERAMSWVSQKIFRNKGEVRLMFLDNPWQMNQLWYCSESCIGAIKKEMSWIFPYHFSDGGSVTPYWLKRFCGDGVFGPELKESDL